MTGMLYEKGRTPRGGWRRYYFLTMADAVPLSLPVFGLLNAVLATLFFLALMGGLMPSEFKTSDAYLTALGTAAFFALVNAYALSAGAHVIREAKWALGQLGPHVDYGDGETANLQRLLEGGSKNYIRTLLGSALAAGLIHYLLLALQGAQTDGIVNVSLYGVGSMIGTCVTWCVLLPVFASQVNIARIFAEVGRHHVKINLFNPEHLKPFETVAVTPVVCLIGVQMFYPLLFLGGQFDPWVILPGFSCALFALIFMLVVPTRGLRARIREEKREALEKVNQQIADVLAGEKSDLEGAGMMVLSNLLSMRAYLSNLSESPVQFAARLRWLLYLFVPPATWAAAALMEQFIDQLMI